MEATQESKVQNKWFNAIQLFIYPKGNNTSLHVYLYSY